jgi:hypothetical protein
MYKIHTAMLVIISTIILLALILISRLSLLFFPEAEYFLSNPLAYVARRAGTIAVFRQLSG